MYIFGLLIQDEVQIPLCLFALSTWDFFFA
jgi:hypothetical protein